MTLINLLPIPLARLSSVQQLALMALPHGGQRSARRNAWAAMSEGSARARGRREADAAMDLAVVRAAATQTAIRAASMAAHPSASAR